MSGLVIAFVLFLSSTLSHIFTQEIVHSFNINLFTGTLSTQIPGYSAELVAAKTYDMLEFVIFLALFGGFSVVNYLFIRKKKVNVYVVASALIFVVLLFIETLFVVHSGKLIIALGILSQFFLIFFAQRKQSAFDWMKAAHGFFAGLFMLVVLNTLTTSTALPLAMLCTLPFIYQLFDSKWLLSKAHIVLPLVVFFPFSVSGQIGVFVFFILGTFIFGETKKITPKHYGLIALLAFAYNPLFYFGTFDTIEEGFWLAWLERMSRGQSLYKDFYAYHPPLIAWGLNLFSQLTGYSLYYFRLYLHLLQLIGLGVFFYFVDTLLASKPLKILVMVCILAFTSTLVRNNVEIRLAAGIVPLLFFYLFDTTKNYKHLFFAGIFSVVAVGVSIETGLAVGVTASLSLLYIILKSKKDFIKISISYVGGVVAMSLPVLFVFIAQHSLQDFVKNMLYILSVFSKGYRNIALERPESSTLLQWYGVDRYLSTTTFLWESVRFILVGSFVFVVTRGKDIKPRDMLALALGVFSLISMRSALGRSDYYHVLLVLIPALILGAYLVEKVLKDVKMTTVLALGIIIALLFRNQFSKDFFQNTFIKFQTYGNLEGNYPSYSNARAGIYTEIDVDTKSEDDLYDYIAQNSTQDDSIFVFPQKAEVYFLTDRKNATHYDTPFIYFTQEHQMKMIEELKSSKPKYIIYGENVGYSGFGVQSLPLVNEYILENYKSVASYGEWSILQ